MKSIGVTIVLMLGVAGVAASIDSNKQQQGTQPATMTLESDSFIAGKRLPVDFTCEGKNISPHLRWGNVPAGVMSFSIICDDPDAPTKNFVHWLIYNIPISVSALPVNVSAKKSLKDGSLQGVNGFGRIGYGGACPPRGHGVHRYVFTIYALDCILNLESGVSRADLDKAMVGHILAKGQLIGTYSRS